MLFVHEFVYIPSRFKVRNFTAFFIADFCLFTLVQAPRYYGYTLMFFRVLLTKKKTITTVLNKFIFYITHIHDGHYTSAGWKTVFFALCVLFMIKVYKHNK